MFSCPESIQCWAYSSHGKDVFFFNMTAGRQAVQCHVNYLIGDDSDESETLFPGFFCLALAWYSSGSSTRSDANYALAVDEQSLELDKTCRSEVETVSDRARCGEA